MDIGCIVMASGLGSRFHQGYKLLTPLQGKPLLTHLLTALPKESFAQAVVVTRNQEVAALAAAMGYQTLLHQMPHQSDTVKLGLGSLDPVDGCMFCVSDQPGCTRQTFQRFLSTVSNHPQDIVRLYYQDTPGNPIYFPASYFPDLLALEGEQGGGAVARCHQVRPVQAANPQELADVDTLADLAQFQ